MPVTIIVKIEREITLAVSISLLLIFISDDWGSISIIPALSLLLFTLTLGLWRDLSD